MSFQLKRESVNSYLLGIIMTLLAVIGFLTRSAYAELKENVATIQSTVSSIERRTIVLETLITPPAKRTTR